MQPRPAVDHLLESSGANMARVALAESMRFQRESGELPPLRLTEPSHEVPQSTIEPEGFPVNGIDPQTFWEMKAKVDLLLKMEEERAKAIRELKDTVDAMRLQMAEAKGGWKLLMLLGGSASALGSLLTYFFTHGGSLPRPPGT